MTACRFRSYTVPEGPPFYANGGYRSITQCEEHHCVIEGIIIDNLCPIGRIEQAVEDGLEKIRKEINHGQTIRERAND